MLKELPKYYKKFLTKDEQHSDHSGPMLAYEDDCSPQMGKWKDILIKRLQAEAESENEEGTEDDGVGYEEPDVEMTIDEDDRFIITNKNRK